MYHRISVYALKKLINFRTEHSRSAQVLVYTINTMN